MAIEELSSGGASPGSSSLANPGFLAALFFFTGPAFRAELNSGTGAPSVAPPNNEMGASGAGGGAGVGALKDSPPNTSLAGAGAALMNENPPPGDGGTAVTLSTAGAEVKENPDCGGVVLMGTDPEPTNEKPEAAGAAETGANESAHTKLRG